MHCKFLALERRHTLNKGDNGWSSLSSNKWTRNSTLCDIKNMMLMWIFQSLREWCIHMNLFSGFTLLRDFFTSKRFLNIEGEVGGYKIQEKCFSMVGISEETKATWRHERNCHLGQRWKRNSSENTCLSIIDKMFSWNFIISNIKSWLWKSIMLNVIYLMIVWYCWTWRTSSCTISWSVVFNSQVLLFVLWNDVVSILVGYICFVGLTLWIYCAGPFMVSRFRLLQLGPNASRICSRLLAHDSSMTCYSFIYTLCSLGFGYLVDFCVWGYAFLFSSPFTVCLGLRFHLNDLQRSFSSVLVRESFRYCC